MREKGVKSHWRIQESKLTLNKSRDDNSSFFFKIYFFKKITKVPSQHLVLSKFTFFFFFGLVLFLSILSRIIVWTHTRLSLKMRHIKIYMDLEGIKDHP